MVSSEATVVGITGLDAGPNPHPGVAVALALRADSDFKGRLIGLPYDPMMNGALMDDLFDAYSMFPWPGDSEASYIAGVRRAQHDHGLNVLLPCLDSDVPTLARLRDQLADMGVRCMVPSEDSIKKRLKWNLPELGRRLGIDVPKTNVIYDTEQLHPVDGWSFPLFIKGSLADAEPAHNEEEAAYLFKRMARRWGYPVMAQEARSGVEYLLSTGAEVLVRRLVALVVAAKSGTWRMASLIEELPGESVCSKRPPGLSSLTGLSSFQMPVVRL